MSLWLIFRHYLHRKLSKCQFLMKSVMEILTKWRHFRISERYEFNTVLSTSVVYSFTVPHSRHMTCDCPVLVLSENAEDVILKLKNVILPMWCERQWTVYVYARFKPGILVPEAPFLIVSSLETYATKLAVLTHVRRQRDLTGKYCVWRNGQLRSG